MRSWKSEFTRTLPPGRSRNASRQSWERLMPADDSLRIMPRYPLCRAWMPPFQRVDLAPADSSERKPVEVGSWRDQLPLNVMPMECPLEELGGEKSTLPNSCPLSLKRFEYDRSASVGIP